MPEPGSEISTGGQFPPQPAEPAATHHGGDPRSQHSGRQKGFRLRAEPLVAALLFAYAGVSLAALGGPPEQFAEATTAAARVTAAGTNYLTRDTTLASGTRVSEYVSAGGRVFAVTWEGPVLPDLKALLGNHFDALLAESARVPRAGRSRIAVNLPEVVINSGGHMRAFEGSAWIPADFPAGFSAGDLR